MFDKKLKKLRYLDLTLLKIRVGSSQRTTDPGPRLVDPVDDEDEGPGPQTSGSNVWQCDLKKMEEY